MKDIVYIKGNIIFKSGVHLVKNMVAYAGEEWEKIADEIIDEDLTITEQDTLMTYKTYCASKGILVYDLFVSIMQSPERAIKIFNEEIQNLQKLRKEKISSDLKYVLNRQIYIGVVGTLELFLSDFLFSMVLGYRKYYIKYCENCSRTFKLKEISTKNWRISDGIATAIVDTNYHQIKEIKKTYKKILGLALPTTKNLEKMILTRHNLVHRNGYPSKDSEYIEINDKMIDDLILEVQSLANHILNKKQTEIKKYYFDITKN